MKQQIHYTILLSLFFCLLLKAHALPKNDVCFFNDFDMIVAKDGSGDYTSIQEAINNTKSYPYDKITIFVKKGVYNEKVKIYQWNPKVTLIGENKENTIISFNDYFDGINLGRNSTFHTPTLQINGNDCTIKNLTIENTAGKVGQAIALTVNANRVLIENCNIKGNQDTVFLSGEGFKQYFKNCYIEGTTDFIFGQATAVFEDCTIHSKSDSYITAASTDKNTKYGFVFINCKLTADKDVTKVYLGRPWRIYAKTVFLNCTMGSHILPIRWHDWNKNESHKNSFYAEYQTKGASASSKDRVKWSHLLTSSEAKNYTLESILKDRNSIQPWYTTNK
ncbi:pectinesterase family protein [Galbibacter orientalis]|uniref:pectinesterase family protein n=1 Tax=Galbibacter orientalis TaxID=453852 RepID=UPI00307FEE6C